MDSAIAYSDFDDLEILPCTELSCPELKEMLGYYNIIEFNTAVKPFYLEYLFAKNPEIQEIFYLDPDLYFYQSPSLLSAEFDESEILLTPNLIYTQDKPSTGEFASLRHGMNNLGFIGLRRGEESFRLIKWWKERLIKHCRIDKCFGIFVDQKWMDLAPLFFDRVKSVKHPGWNMAWWNFSERNLLKTPQGYFVNQENMPLIFFHFSGYRVENTKATERQISDEFIIKEGSPLEMLYEDYRALLLANDYELLSQIKPGLDFYRAPNSSWNNTGRKIKSKVNNLIYRIFKV